MGLNADTREINTGNLEVDGSPLEVRVERMSSADPNREWHEVIASNGNGYSNSRVVAPLGRLSSTGIASREIVRALDQGHRVTSESASEGEINFRKLFGRVPIAVGYSRFEIPRSAGRFFLRGLLGQR